MLIKMNNSLQGTLEEDTSAGVSGRGGRDNCPGASRYSFITISKVGSLDGRGMNTCARW